VVPRGGTGITKKGGGLELPRGGWEEKKIGSQEKKRKAAGWGGGTGAGRVGDKGMKIDVHLEVGGGGDPRPAGFFFQES